MKKCLRISCKCRVSKDLTENIKKEANKLTIEGNIQVTEPDNLKIVACGSKENIDRLIDSLYKLGSKKNPFSVEIEPFLKEKDYRGIFRVIS